MSKVLLTLTAIPKKKIEYVFRLSQKAGASRQGAAVLTADFLTEAGFDPTAVGDGGHGHGLAMLHDEYKRNVGMPTTLEAQIPWLIDVEMPRSGNSQLARDIRDPNAALEQLKTGVLNWERPGIVGKRFINARKFLSEVTPDNN